MNFFKSVMNIVFLYIVVFGEEEGGSASNRLFYYIEAKRTHFLPLCSLLAAFKILFSMNTSLFLRLSDFGSERPLRSY